MTTYTVFLNESHSVQVLAAKIDPGEFRLWFYDEQDNLVAAFWWKNIKGFTVEGTAADQQLVWDHFQRLLTASTA
jgi:hypothetical protein